MENKVLKLVVFAGNVLCVYRNYLSFSFVGRGMIWLRVFIEFTALVICKTSFVLYYRDNTSQLAYLFMSLFSSFCLISLALYHSKNFVNLTKLIETTHAYFINDKEYKECLNKRFWKIVVVMISYTSFIFGLIIYNTVQFEGDIANVISYVLVTLSSYFSNVRYSFEYIAICCLLFILYEQLNCIIRRISQERLANLMANTHNGVPYYTSPSSPTSNDIAEEMTSFEDLTTLYSNIKQCSNLINAIFGLEITIILSILVFFLIMFLYELTYISVKGIGVEVDFMSYVMKIIVFLLALYILSWSGQAVQNRVDTLRRCLGKLLIHCTEDIVCYKETKNLLHLISSQPIRIQAFGSIDINMSLLPKFIMFFTSYTVIALQFNNVV